MSDEMAEDVRTGLTKISLESLREVSRLSVRSGDRQHTVLRLWSDGFSVDADDVPPLRGVVDLFDKEQHLSRCLVVALDTEGGEMRYGFKRSTAVTENPPRDFCEDMPAYIVPSVS
jgi:hypothetical protein